MNLNIVAVFSTVFLTSILLADATPLPVDDALIAAVPTYQRDIQPMLEAHCMSCHGPRKSAKRQLDTYDAVSDKIDEILYRVQLPSNNRKFMPYKMRQTPLSKAEISLLKAWRAGGLLEN